MDRLPTYQTISETCRIVGGFRHRAVLGFRGTSGRTWRWRAARRWASGLPCRTSPAPTGNATRSSRGDPLSHEAQGRVATAGQARTHRRSGQGAYFVKFVYFVREWRGKNGLSGILDRIISKIEIVAHRQRPLRKKRIKRIKVHRSARRPPGVVMVKAQHVEPTGAWRARP